MIAPMKTEARYSLAELARVTGVTPRTVRYYIAQGLLPGANEAGPGASYDADHLARLRLIRELQRQHLPLAEIRTRLVGLRSDEIAVLLDEQASAAAKPVTSSALDYIRGVLGTNLEPRQARRVLRSMRPGTDPAAGPAAPSAPALFRRAAQTPSAPPAPSSAPANLAEAIPPPYEAPTAERSQWDRIALTNDIELHVRRPLSRLDNKRVERLITIARQVLGEEQP